MTKYKVIATFGTLLMGVACGIACLAESAVMANFGSGLLIVSILVMLCGFSKWRP